MRPADHTTINNAFFRRYEPIYDLLVLPLVRIRRRVVVLSGVSPAMNVLDVACGTGEQSIAFAHAGASVTGVDLSPDMLGKAKRKGQGMPITFLKRMQPCCRLLMPRLISRPFPSHSTICRKKWV